MFFVFKVWLQKSKRFFFLSFLWFWFFVSHLFFLFYFFVVFFPKSTTLSAHLLLELRPCSRWNKQDLFQLPNVSLPASQAVCLFQPGMRYGFLFTACKLLTRFSGVRCHRAERLGEDGGAFFFSLSAWWMIRLVLNSHVWRGWLRAQGRLTAWLNIGAMRLNIECIDYK